MRKQVSVGFRLTSASIAASEGVVQLVPQLVASSMLILQQQCQQQCQQLN